MGYVPPPAPSNYRAQLYTLARIYDVAGQFLGPAKPQSRLSAYRQYLMDLYGPAGRDWFMVINYGLLIAFGAFILVVLLVTGIL